MFKFCQFILTFGYLGLSKRMPGTCGSFGGLLLWLFASMFFYNLTFSVFFQNFLWLIISLIMTLFACQKIEFYVKNFSKKSLSKTQNIDNQTIVLDEVVGQIIALQIALNAVGDDYFLNYKIIFCHLLMSFVAFRFFDITKPSIVGIIDKKMKNAFGVMFDDIVSGLIAGLLVYIILKWIILS